jgi:hypothetical protein
MFSTTSRSIFSGWAIALWLIAQVVGAQIDGHDLKMLGERRNLVVPAVPVIGLTVDEDDEWAGALGDVMNLDAAGIDEAVLYLVRNVG